MEETIYRTLDNLIANPSGLELGFAIQNMEAEKGIPHEISLEILGQKRKDLVIVALVGYHIALRAHRKDSRATEKSLLRLRETSLRELESYLRME